MGIALVDGVSAWWIDALADLCPVILIASQSRRSECSILKRAVDREEFWYSAEMVRQVGEMGVLMVRAAQSRAYLEDRYFLLLW